MLRLISVCAVVALLLPVFYFQLSLDVETWIDKETFNKIIDIKLIMEERHLTTPIFVFYKIDSGMISYYSNVIGMEIGQHYVYYGKVQFLISGEITPSYFLPSQFSDGRAAVFFDTLNKSGVIDNIDSYPIVLIMPTFYNENLGNLVNIGNYEVKTGIVLIPPRDENTKTSFLDSILTCYTDYINQSGSSYQATYNWTIAKYVLEHYSEEANASRYSVEFPIFIFNNLTSALSIRIFDAARNWSPIDFYLDNSLMLIYNYTGKMGPANVTITVPQGLTGLHKLILTTEGNRQILRLDIIVISYDE